MASAYCACVLEEFGGEQVGLDQVGADVRGDAGVDQRHPLGVGAVERVGEREESLGGAVARAGDHVERHLLAGGEAVAQVEERRVGDAAGQRVVDDLDGVGLAADLRQDLGMRHDRGAVEVQRAVLAAGEDRLGRDEVAGEGERQRLVILAVGGERVAAGHAVELGPGGGEVVAAHVDPAGEEVGEERVQRVAGLVEDA